MAVYTRGAFVLAIVSALVVMPSAISAQACHGTPGGASLGYEYGKMSVGRSQGVSGALAGQRVAVGAGLAVRDLGELSGQQAALRFSLVLPFSKLTLCPGLGAIYQHDSWEQPDATLTAHWLSLRAGAGLGFEQHVYGGFSINPFVVAQYDFTVSAFDLDVTSSDSANVELVADTLSRVQIEYGLIGRYRFLYGGIAAHRTGDQKGTRPYMARWIVGVSFSTGRSTRAAPAPARRTAADMHDSTGRRSASTPP